MKTCFVKQQNEWRVLSGNWPYSRLLADKHTIISRCADVPFLGFLYGLKCDFLVYDGALRLDEYDIIITLGPFIKKRPAGCKGLYYMNPEPDFDLSSLPVEPYDAILNNYTDVRHERNVPYWYRYLLGEMAKYKQAKRAKKILIGKRTGKVALDGWETVTEAWGSRSYSDYYQELSTCNYAINLDESPSAGQIIAECSIFDVICFGKKQKLFQRMLFPEYCDVNTFDEASNKIKDLENNPALRNSILGEIAARRSAIDCDLLSLPKDKHWSGQTQIDQSICAQAVPSPSQSEKTTVTVQTDYKLEPTSNSPPRIAFALSTKERIGFTARILPAIDCGGFDLIWCDGSKTPEGRAFASRDHFKKTPLIEIHHDVTGGPDAAIQFSLKRLLELGYDYVGLIENDILLQPGWLGAMMSAWQGAENGGLRVGAVTARTAATRVLAVAPNYSVIWNLGAGMALFSRAGAEALLADYHYPRLPTAKQIRNFWLARLGIDVSDNWELFMDQPDRTLGADWHFAMSIFRRGMVSLGVMPNFAENIEEDFEQVCRTKYLRTPDQELPSCVISVAELKERLDGKIPVNAKRHRCELTEEIKFGAGVHLLEGESRWLEPRAEITMPSRLLWSPAELKFTLGIGDWWCYGNQPVQVTVTLGGRTLARLCFGSDGETQELSVPVEPADTPQPLVIESDTAFVPAKLDEKSRDQRTLAVKLQNLSLVENS